QPAVSPIFNRQVSGNSIDAEAAGDLAGYKPAIQEGENLRYVGTEEFSRLAAESRDSAAESPRYLRWLIWTYFWLLIFEGALRKWALPSLANPLLVIRDPVLLAIYALAFARQIFPVNKFVIALTCIGVLSLTAGLIGPYANL